MNEWIMITRSRYGKGAVAAKDIPKGTQIIQYKGKKVSSKLAEKISDKHRDQVTAIGTGTLWLFTLNKDYDVDGSRQGNDAQYLNHSCEPNCEAINYDDEEILLNGYRPDANPLLVQKQITAWLEEKFTKEIKMPILVQPVIIFPGWFVKSPNEPTIIKVMNPRELIGFLENKRDILSDNEMTLLNYKISKLAKK